MSVCARCGATFSCAMADGGDGQPCWCTRLPPVVPVPVPAPPAAAMNTACWCPDCLRRHIAAAAPPGN